MEFKQEAVVNNGQGPQPKVERNEELAKDYLDKMPMFKMVEKYQISPKNIYAILDKLKVPRNRKLESISDSKPFWKGKKGKGRA